MFFAFSDRQTFYINIPMNATLAPLRIFFTTVLKSPVSQKKYGVLRPPAGRQYRMPISQQPFNRSLKKFQQLLQIKAKLTISVHLHMGNYVNQVHHTINTGESREVKIKLILLDLPLPNNILCTLT